MALDVIRVEEVVSMLLGGTRGTEVLKVPDV
jgi:hypothetical protein